MFTPAQQQELNTIQANIKTAIADLQRQVNELKEQLKEHDHGSK